MRPFVFILCGALLCAPAPLQQQQTPVFRGGVELVTLDVTVVDKDGKPVKGLTPGDFAVNLDGQPRPVRALDFLEFGTSVDSVVAAPKETTNAETQTPSAKRGGRVMVLLFDDLSCRPGQAKALTAAALRMLPTLSADDLIGITTTSGLGPVVNPTRDRAAVIAALESKTLIGRDDDSAAPFYIGIHEAIEIDRGQGAAADAAGLPPTTLTTVAARECPILGLPPDVCSPMVAAAGRMLAQNTVHRTAIQMAAYQALITALRPAPAPRAIIVLSNGVATNPAEDLPLQLDAISRAAAEAGVQVYALTEVADSADASALTFERAAVHREESAFLNRGIQTVASAAGGEAFLVIGTPDRFFTRIVSETSGLYRLGVEVPVLPVQHRFFATKVSVRPSSLTVRVHRQALLASALPETVSVDARLQTTLAQGGVAYGVPIALGTAQRRDPTGHSLQLGVNVQVPSTAQGPLVAMFAVINDAGRIVQSGRKDVSQPRAGEDYRVAVPLLLEDGQYQLRVAVADARGNVGSVERRIRAGLSHVGAFSVSDLLTTWAGADGTPRFLALETLPDGAATLRVSLELYSDSGSVPPPDVIVRVALLRAGEDQPVLEGDLTPTPSGATLSAAAEMRVDRLEAGTYTIRATILEAGAVTGTVSALIRKAGKGP
jgi:VWFA-related protein